MSKAIEQLPRVAAALVARAVRRASYGGAATGATCPGWVLVTIMTAGLVTALWLVADDKLQAAVQRRAGRGRRQRTLTRRRRPMPAGRRRRGRPSSTSPWSASCSRAVPGAAPARPGAARAQHLVASAAEGARYGANADRDPAEGAAVTRQLIRDSLADSFADDVTSGTGDGRRRAPRSSSGSQARLPVFGLLGPPRGISVRGHALEEGR